NCRLVVHESVLISRNLIES
ncbi:unnamed protein product, partial [Callosobruchus maculatus]